MEARHRGSMPLVWMDDPRLLRLGMSVIHPRRAVLPIAGGPEHVVRYADPPVELAELPALATQVGEPVELPRALHGGRQPHLHRPRAAGALGAQPLPRSGRRLRHGRRAGDVLHRARNYPRWRPGWTTGRHRLAEEWTASEADRAVLPAVRRHPAGSDAAAGGYGSLCLDCRTDRAGVPWSANYDRFHDYPPRRRRPDAGAGGS